MSVDWTSVAASLVKSTVGVASCRAFAPPCPAVACPPRPSLADICRTPNITLTCPSAPDGIWPVLGAATGVVGFAAGLAVGRGARVVPVVVDEDREKVQRRLRAIRPR